jgi:hypothetical protein
LPFSGGGNGATPALLAGSAVELVCMGPFIIASRRGNPLATFWPERLATMDGRVTTLPFDTRKCLSNQAEEGIVVGVRNRVTRFTL